MPVDNEAKSGAGGPPERKVDLSQFDGVESGVDGVIRLLFAAALSIILVAVNLAVVGGFIVERIDAISFFGFAVAVNAAVLGGLVILPRTR